MSTTRRARVRALAKINLDLRVLGKRPDGYHELRTIFQTVSLADSIEVAYTPARATRISLAGGGDIPESENLAVRAARAVMEATRLTGAIEMILAKRIPPGAGLGGGSSDAAAVLLALPVLAGGRLDIGELTALGAALGSDVPFFLHGGTAAAIGRGTELFPLPDAPPKHGLLVVPDVHVPTPEAYAALSPHLTVELQQNKIVSFQSNIWAAGLDGANDFEEVVFARHPGIASKKRTLLRLGACPVRMSGSGSAVFGFFPSREDAVRALRSLREERVYPISLVNRARYRAMWWRSLRAHINNKVWPPPSRYAR
jgi:4-diphosphocytidyl-2-C-methyl-D-erythritol kinase